MLDDRVLLQVYFYKTYLYQQSVKRSLQFNSTKSTEGSVENSKDNRYKTSFEWFYMYSPELFLLFNELRSTKKAVVKRRSKQKRVFVTQNAMKQAAMKSNKVFGKRRVPASLTVHSTARPQHSVTMCNNFFTYFFLHFFKQQAVVLAKSLYKAVTANALFKHEHQVLLYRTRFLK